MKPQDGKYKAFGQLFKIGRHGFVYRWDGHEWVRSQVPPDAVVRTRGRSSIRRDYAGRPGSGRFKLPLVDGKKECRGKHGCGEWKPVTDFYISKDGYLLSQCKKCETKRRASYKVAA